MIIVIRNVKFDFTNEFPMLIRSAILDSSCFSSEKGMWRAGSNEEFNITAEAVDGWMTTENDDVVKPKNCFEFATNSWGKYGGRREGPVSDFSTVYFERRKRANPRGDRFTYYHDSICVRGFSRWPRELETRAALELSKLSFLVTPPISLLCIFVIRTFLRGRFLRRNLSNLFNVPDIGICLLQKRVLLIRWIEISRY